MTGNPMDEKIPDDAGEVPRARAYNDKIAFLVRHPDRLHDVHCCAEALLALGAGVSVICLGQPEFLPAVWKISPILDTEADCFTDDPALAHRYGMTLLSPAEIGYRLNDADWVIPF